VTPNEFFDLDVVDHDDADMRARPAATVVLVRDSAGGPEVLMVHRGADTAFGGMWAFPGGAIEPGDVPEGSAPDPLPAARRAAVRETHEEVGLVVDTESLVWWSHWLPPPDSPKRFSTWFFVAPAAAHVHVVIDGSEILGHRWIAPTDALAAQLHGEIEVSPPTYVTLEQLVRYGDVVTLLAAANPEAFASEVAYDGEGTRLCVFDGDVAYGEGDPDAAGPRRRLVMDDEAGWRYLSNVAPVPLTRPPD
jgi:8-oxo-dGTP pyrophosphatase MutT (NUDIX family)